MRRWFIFILITVSSTAQAQSSTTELRTQVTSESSERFFRRAIPQTQMIVANFKNAGQATPEVRGGWGGGALFDLGRDSKWVTESGLIYQQVFAGSQRNSAKPTQSLSVPVAFKYYFTGQDETSFYAKAGLELSTVSSTGEFGSSYNTGALFGIGLKYILTPQIDIYVDATYVRSIESMLQKRAGLDSLFGAAAGVGFNLL